MMVKPGVDIIFNSPTIIRTDKIFVQADASGVMKAGISVKDPKTDAWV